MGQIKRKSISQKPESQPCADLNDLRKRLAELEITLSEHIQGDGLHETQSTHRILLDESSDPIFTFYPDGRYRYVNKAFANGVGKNMDEIIGKKIWDIFPQEEADKRFAVVKWVFENAETKIIEVRVPRSEGDTYYLTTVKPILNESKQVVSVICISKEITERKLMEQELKHLSTHDNLTTLYNRNFFETEMARIQSGRLFPISIVVADVDNLKTVNDKFGHSAGDELLRKVAGQLRKSFRGDDIVARIGGDEFSVLLPQMDEEATAAIVARLRKDLENLNDPSIRLSIGLAIGREGCDLSEVMRLADDRMYLDKYAHKKVKGLDPFSQ